MCASVFDSRVHFKGNGSLLNVINGTEEILPTETIEQIQNQDLIKALDLLQNDPLMMSRLLPMAQAS